MKRIKNEKKVFKIINLDVNYKKQLDTSIQDEEFVSINSLYDLLDNEITIEKKNFIENVDILDVTVIDVRGLELDIALSRVEELLLDLYEGHIIKMQTINPEYENGLKDWSRKTGNKIVKVEKSENSESSTDFYIEKSEEFVYIANTLEKQQNKSGKTTEKVIDTFSKKEKGAIKSSIVVFDGNYEKIFASLIIANGALEMGNRVTMFFTFWGLNALRKKEGELKISKNIFQKMLEKIMPKRLSQVNISKMDFGSGIGNKILKYTSKDKTLSSLQDLLKEFIDNNGKIIACTLSMEMLGISKEELITGIEYGGINQYMKEADEANHNLFI